VDISSGNLTSWDPNADGSVTTLACNDGKIYAGGLFTSIGGENRNRLAALDQNSGLATEWNPNSDDLILSITLNNGTLYAGGRQKSLSNIPNSGIAAISEQVTGIKEADNSTPKEFKLFQNFPNPFNPSTTISWQSPAGGWHTLKVYDVLGNEVATLIDEYKPAGIHNVKCKMNNLASGIYFYQIKAGDFIQTKKMILLK